MSIWVEIIVGVLRILLPAFLESQGPQEEDAQRQPELRSRLQRRIRQVWGAAAIVLLLLPLMGCARTVYVPPGEPVRLRETVKGAKVWVLGQDGKAVAGEMDLPRGWYCLPLEEGK